MTQICKDGNDDDNDYDYDDDKYANVVMTRMTMMTQIWKDGNGDGNDNDNDNDNDKYSKVTMTMMTMMTTWKWHTGLSSPVTVLVSLENHDNHVLV